jgi:hypothetical protein
MIWRVLPLVKINTRISETPCIKRVTYIFFSIGVSGVKTQISYSLNIPSIESFGK